MRLSLWSISSLFLLAVNAELSVNFNSALPSVAYLITGLPRSFLLHPCIYTGIHRTIIMGITGSDEDKHSNPSVFLHFSDMRPKELTEKHHASWSAVQKLYNPVHVDFDPPDPPLANNGSFICARWGKKSKKKTQRMRAREVEQYSHIEQSFVVAFDYERTHNVTFDYFARVRFDVVFGRPLPGLRDLYPPSEKFTLWYSPLRANGLISDQFALLPRAIAAKYFKIASSTFVRCKDLDHEKNDRISGEILVTEAMRSLPHTTLTNCWFFIRILPGGLAPYSGQFYSPTCIRELKEFQSSCSLT
mmetsp:Transcript_15813/g.40638  ORF Transcript_15813/g.40638 Transcript_15813/m.40638 type:complete len:303 (+) Transcript_15813:375-1283(+)